MLKYLVVLLDDASTSFCHYPVPSGENRFIPLDILKDGVLFALKQNLNVQFVYPDYDLPETYKELIDSIEHVDIVTSKCDDRQLRDNADIVVFNGLEGIETFNFDTNKAYVLRVTRAELFGAFETISSVIPKVGRLNIVITDLENFKEEDFDKYKELLSKLSVKVKELYVEGKSPQLNLITDRLILTSMNNCNAGDEVVTLAPDGKFYICPGFYYDGAQSVGNPNDGVQIGNSQLYRLKYAPICRSCDAYQCKRCVWLNRKMTLEVNTPSREQCVTAHLERNQSRDLLNNIRIIGEFMSETSIPEIDYLDPFDKLKEL